MNHLVLSQIIPRIISACLNFLLNRSIIQSADPVILSVERIQFKFLLQTMFLLTRKAVHDAHIRTKIEPSFIIFIPICGAIIVAPLIFSVINQSSIIDNNTLLCLALAILLEAWVEPIYLAFTLHHNHLTLILDILPASARILSTYFAFHYLNLQLTSFAIGHVIYPLVVILCNYTLLPVPAPLYPFNNYHKREKTVLFTETLSFIKEFQIYSIQDWLFQELVPYVLFSLDFNTRQQVSFSVISNIASLLVRHIFAPLEKIYTRRFAQQDIMTSCYSLYTILFYMTVLQAILITLSLLFGNAFLSLVYGEYYSTGGPLLSLYLFYIYTSSFYGITWAFAKSWNNQDTIGRITRNNFWLSLCELGLSFIITSQFSLYGMILNQIFFISLRLYYMISLTIVDVNKLQST